MDRLVTPRAISVSSNRVQRALRSVELLHSAPQDRHDDMKIDTVVVFSLRGSRTNMDMDAADIQTFFRGIFAISGISEDKFPEDMRIDNDNHTVQFSGWCDWTEDDSTRFSGLMEVLASYALWTFTHFDGAPINAAPLFSEGVRS